MNPVYENSWVKLYQGDCLDILPQLDMTFDCCITDPPYGTTKCRWDSIIPFEFMWNELKRLVKLNGAICLFGSEPFSSKLICSQIEEFSHSWVWIKETGSNFLTSGVIPLKIHEGIYVFYISDDINSYKELREYFYNEKIKHGLTNKEINQILGYSTSGSGMAGHYFKKDKAQFCLPSRKDYEKLQAHNYFEKDYDELLEMYYREKKKRIFNPQKTKGKPYRSIKECKRKDFDCVYGNKLKEVPIVNNGDRFPTSCLYFKRDKTRFHPTQKPVALIEYLIKTYTNENDYVLDFTAGSGTTGIAAMETNRKAILIEKEQKYCEITIKRLQDKEKEIAERLF